MHTQNVNTAAAESDKRWDENQNIARIILDETSRMKFIPALFCTLQAEAMVYNWMSRNTSYQGANWNYYEIPEGIAGRVAAWTNAETKWTGYMAPDLDGPLTMSIPGNYFESEVSPDAAGIIVTIMILNQLSWAISEMGPGYQSVVNKLIDRQDALKDFVSITNHPEAHLIYRAID